MNCPTCNKEMKKSLVDLDEDVIEVGMVFPRWAFIYSCCDWQKTVTGDKPIAEALKRYRERNRQYGF